MFVSNCNLSSNPKFKILAQYSSLFNIIQKRQPKLQQNNGHFNYIKQKADENMRIIFFYS